MNPNYKRLIKRGWVVGASNHYFVLNKRHLFVIMTKGKHFIKEEGCNEDAVWERLVNLADEIENTDKDLEVSRLVVDFVENCVIHDTDHPEVVRFIESLAYKSFYFRAKQALGQEIKQKGINGGY